jgi:hypothetical protein
MAEFYLDVSAVGNEYQAYADTPTTWGVPQDGNGKAATGGAVAIATINCNGASASGTGTVGVLGVTVSSTLNASGAALATAIVTAINASTTAVGASFSAALLPLNRLVSARVNPGVSTEVQIMLRIAGTDWNGIAPTRANITGGGVTAFAGGADGPFAYLSATSSLFGRAARAYGVFSPTKSAAVSDPDVGDVIHHRTSRGGINLGTTMTEASARYDWDWGPASSTRMHLFDDGTVWPGDAGLFTLTISVPGGVIGGSNSLRVGGTALVVSSRSGRRFRLYLDVPTGVNGFLIGMASLRVWDGVILEEAPNLSGAGLFYQNNAGGSVRYEVSNSKIIARGARQLASSGTNPGTKTTYSKVEFEYTGLTNNVTGLVNLNAGAAANHTIRFIGCSFRDVNGVYSVVSPIVGGNFSTATHAVEFDGCSGVEDVAPGWSAQVNDGGRQFLWENFGPSRDWRVESGLWLAEWRAGQNFPTLTSVLPSGAPWSAKVLLRNGMQWGFAQKVMKLPGYYRAATAQRTFTLEFLAQQSFTKSQLGVYLAYIDEDGVVRYQSTLQPQSMHIAAPEACPASSANWNMNGQSGFTACKLSLLTEYPVKAGTEFVVWLVANGELASDQTIYVNAEVDIL